MFQSFPSLILFISNTYGNCRMAPCHKLGKVTDVRDGASFIYPENVARTVAEIFGISADFNSVDNSVLPLMSAIKKA